jgi:hypothetical protein
VGSIERFTNRFRAVAEIRALAEGAGGRWNDRAEAAAAELLERIEQRFEELEERLAAVENSRGPVTSAPTRTAASH